MSDTPTMNTGDVSRRLGVPVTADLLKELGFTHVAQDKRALLWRQSDYPAMCVSLAQWIKDRQNVPMQPAPSRAPKKTAQPAGENKTGGTTAYDNDDDF